MPHPQKNRILLIGPTGQVGSELLPRLSAFGEAVALDRSKLDLASNESVRDAVRTVKPDVIVNAAAYTAVDRAESEPELALQINGSAPGVLAEEARRCRAILVHYSTDYVFDGRKGIPYVEADPVHPLNEYGKSKLAGEKNIAGAGGAYFLLRTSWVYSPRGSNFLRTMLRLGSERETFRVVIDQIGSPTSASVVANATLAILEHCRAHGPDMYGPALEHSGIYHATCAGHISWFNFACAIFAEARKSGLGARLKVRDVVPIPTEEYPTPAERPRYSVLSNEKMKQAFAFEAPEWAGELTSMMRQLAQRKDLSI